MLYQLIVLLLQVTTAYGLDCFSCSGIDATSECHTVITCSADNQCGVSPASVSTQTSRATLCFDCCSQQNCNNKLCSSVNQTGDDNTRCHDDPVFNCAYVSTTFDICADVNHAKSVCKRFCKLCDLVDGGWAIWSAWSACDTSCGNGSTIRTRTCTNPRPEHGGSNCTGINKQAGICNPQDCPIHGGWSSWSPWGSCSNTCGVGLQQRGRSCSNPYPALFGDHCFGDDKDYRACFERACVDGGWSDWSIWGACNGGQMTRTRTCTNPLPSQFGRNCLGNDMDKQICNTRNGSVHQVVFTVHTPTGNLIGDNTPTFNHILLNEGGAYNETTGRFTCPVQGVYLFTLTLLALDLRSKPVYCDIYQNVTHITEVYSQEDVYDSASITTFLHLSVGEELHLDCINWDNIFKGHQTLYSGSLIRAD